MIANKNERLIRAIKNSCKCSKQDGGANGDSNITYDDVVKLYTEKSLDEIPDWKDINLESAEVGTLFKVAVQPESELDEFNDYRDSHTVHVQNCVPPINYATQTFVGDYWVFQITNSPTVVTNPDEPFV